MSKTWGSKGWTFETFESYNLTSKTLLAILEIWGVTFETWKFVSETYFEVFATTISTFTFTSSGWRSISDVSVMWTS